MEGQPQSRHHYFNSLFNLSTLPDYSMASDYGHLNDYFPSPNHHPPTNGYLSAAAARRPTHSSYFPVAANHRGFSSYNHDSLESDFNRLSISTPNHPSENRNAQVLSRNMGLNLLYTNSQFCYDNNLNGLSNLYMDRRNNSLNGTNLNGLSSYAYNYARANSNLHRPYPSNGLGWQSSSSLIYLSLNDLRGKIALAAKDQIGCRFLQSKFDEGDIEDINLIFSEVKENVCELIVDQFGNYLVQKFFKVGNDEQRTQLLYVLVNDERKFKDICNDMHGTRAVQKLLEHVTTPEQRSIVVSVLRRITLALIKNNNGQHVVEYCLKNFSSEDTKRILNVVADNCLEVATDKSGCCVLQQCLTDLVGESRNRLIAQITSNALILSEHPYGNYVVQYILGLKIGHATSDIMDQLSGNYVSLSMNKYGSNVVEKILKQSDGDEALPIVEELIRSPNFLRVLQDPYGNYVAQSALIASKVMTFRPIRLPITYFQGPAHQALSGLVKANYPFLHSHPHGKRVLARANGFKLRP